VEVSVVGKLPCIHTMAMGCVTSRQWQQWQQQQQQQQQCQ